MSFNIQLVLDDAEQYSASSFNLEGVKPVNYEKLKGILIRWQADLFDHESYSTLEGFNFIKENHALEVFDNVENNDRDVLLSNASMALHSITHHNLTNPKAPTDENLKAISEIFERCANSFTEEDQSVRKIELQQLALHPRLVEKCSEAFLRHIAQVTKSTIYNFQFQDVLESNQDKIQGDKAQLSEVLRKWQADFFMDDFCTLSGKEGLQKEPIQPSYLNLSYIESCVETVKYIATVAAKNNLDGNKSELIKESLSKLKNRLEKLNFFFEMKINKEAAIEARKKIITIHQEHEEKTKKVIDEFSEKLQNAKVDHEDLKRSIEEKPLLKGFFEPKISALETSVLELENNINEANNALQSLISTYEEEVKKLDEIIMNTNIPDPDLATKVPQSHLDDLQILIDNADILTLCYEKFVPFAAGHASRELPKPSKGILGFFWKGLGY